MDWEHVIYLVVHVGARSHIGSWFAHNEKRTMSTSLAYNDLFSLAMTCKKVGRHTMWACRYAILQNSLNRYLHSAICALGMQRQFSKYFNIPLLASYCKSRTGVHELCNSCVHKDFRRITDYNMTLFEPFALTTRGRGIRQVLRTFPRVCNEMLSTGVQDEELVRLIEQIIQITKRY